MKGIVNKFGYEEQLDFMCEFMKIVIKIWYAIWISFVWTVVKVYHHFQPLIVGNQNSLTFFSLNQNQAILSQMSNLSYDTPSILMSTTKDNKHQFKYSVVNIGRLVAFLWVCDVELIKSRGLMWKLSNVLKITRTAPGGRHVSLTCFSLIATEMRIICDIKSMFLDNYSPNSIRAGDLNLNSKHLFSIALRILKRNYMSQALAH